MPAEELNEADRTTLTREAGLGKPPSILTVEAVEFWAARRQDAADLAAAGIRLVPAWEGSDG
jgi:hypothetical protein